MTCHCIITVLWICLSQVKSPDKIDKLLAVYHAIVDNVVTWRCLEENIQLMIRGSHEYDEFRRETMIKLLKMTQPEKTEDTQQNRTEDTQPNMTEGTQPNRTEDIQPKKTEDTQPQKTEDTLLEKTEDTQPQKTEDIHPKKTEDIQPNSSEDTQPNRTEDTITCAIKYGASAMLHEILNTRGVFRFDKGESKTIFDVTDFTRATMSTESIAKSSQQREARPTSDTKAEKSTPVHMQEQGRPRLRFLSFNTEAGTGTSDSPSSPETEPYLRILLNYGEEWRQENILNKQPMRKLTKRYFFIVQSFYFIFGLLQLLFMICFSHFYLPNTCSLTQLFNFTSSASGCSSTPDPSDKMNSELRAGQGNASGSWLLWPVILFLGTVCIYSVDIIFFFYELHNAKLTYKERVNSIRMGAYERWQTKFLLIISQIFPTLSFCISVFFWFFRYNNGTKLIPYLEATSMVFLFGWTTNLVFFTGMNRVYYVFGIVLKQIVVKEIGTSFLLVFFFTLLGFSFALHVLSLYDLPPDNMVYLSATIYDVFASSLGSGDYVENSREQRTRAGIYFDLFEVVVIAYVCVSAIILLNVLIAMLNHRYDKAKQRAENFWRFQILRIALDLEKFATFEIFRKLLLQNIIKDPEFCAICTPDPCRFKQRRETKETRTYLEVKMKIKD